MKGTTERACSSWPSSSLGPGFLLVVQPLPMLGECDRLLFVDLHLPHDALDSTKIDHGASLELLQLRIVPTVGLIPSVAWIMGRERKFRKTA